jgi:hypothetical protein
LTTSTAPLPCVGHAGLYDTVLFDDAPSPQREQALHRAAALCGTCPAQCDQVVTIDTGRHELVLLDPDWMPPAREGKPDPEPRVVRKRVKTNLSAIGKDYIRPDQRIAAWARMAAEYVAVGRSLTDIAEELCVTEETVVRLIALGQQGRAA